MIPDVEADPEWRPAFARIEAAFAGTPRPKHFVQPDHCCECAESDAFFQEHTPLSFGNLVDPIETLPVAFLSEEAFRYLAPGILRFLTRSGEDYGVDGVLFHLENRWQSFDSEQRAAVRDLLSLVSERLQAEIEASAFDAATMSRILDGMARDTG
jgi:hypothetical protein